MLELILKGRPRFYLWLCFLGAIFGLGFIVYIFQANIGLAITGMSRDVSWGLYIAQFTYFVGVAAGAVMLVLPAYFHHYEKFKRIIIFGEFMAHCLRWHGQSIHDVQAYLRPMQYDVFIRSAGWTFVPLRADSKYVQDALCIPDEKRERASWCLA